MWKRYIHVNGAVLNIRSESLTRALLHRTTGSSEMDKEPLSSAGNAPQRRLSDRIARAFFQARERGHVVTAGHLLAALESLTKREAELHPEDRRFRIDPAGVVPAPLASLVESIKISTVDIHNDTGFRPQVAGQSVPEVGPSAIDDELGGAGVPGGLWHSADPQTDRCP